MARTQDRVIGGLRAHTAGKLLSQLVSWAGTIYALRMLDSDAIGLFAVAVGILNYGLVVYDGGVTDSLVQHPPLSKSARRAVFTILVGIGGLVGLVIALSSLALGYWLDDPEFTPIVSAMGAVMLASAFCVMPAAVMTRRMEFRRLATIMSLQSLVSVSATVSGVALGAGAWALVAGMAAGVLVRAVLLNLAHPSLMWPTQVLAPAVPHLRVGGVLIVDSLLWRWYTSIDVFLLARWWGTASAGVFGFAVQIANMPLEKISTIVNDVSLPAYAELANDRRAAARLLVETIRMHAAVGFPIFWGLAAVAEEAVPLLFGAKWTPAVFPVVAMAAIAPLRLIGSLETPAMAGLGRPEVLLATKRVIVPCMTVAIATACFLWGVDGVAWAWLAVFPVCYAYAFRMVLRAAGIGYVEVIQRIRGPALSAGGMAVSVWVLQPSIGPVVDLGIRVAAGAALYGLFLRFLDRDGFALIGSRMLRLTRIRKERLR